MDDYFPRKRSFYDRFLEVISCDNPMNSSTTTSSLGYNIRRARRRTNAVGITLDIVLLGISILVVLILIVVVTWYICKRRRKLKEKHERNLKVFSAEYFPEVAIVKSKISNSGDSTTTKEDTLSVVSSIWDSTSQKFDKTYLEQQVIQEDQIERTRRQLTTNTSMEVNHSCCMVNFANYLPKDVKGNDEDEERNNIGNDVKDEERNDEKDEGRHNEKDEERHDEKNEKSDDVEDETVIDVKKEIKPDGNSYRRFFFI